MNIFIIIIVVVGIIISAIVSTINKKWRKLLHAIADELQLNKGIGIVPRLSGEVNGKKVTIRRQTGFLLIFISHKIENVSLFRINKIRNLTAPETEGNASYRVTNILSGDTKFDETVYVTASAEYYVAALLSRTMRESIFDICKKTDFFEVLPSWMKASIKPPFSPHSKNIEVIGSYVKAITEISNNLTDEKGIRERLIENTLNDPHPVVRYNNLKHLVSKYSHDADAIEAFRNSINDTDVKIQIMAARGLKKEGLKLLLTIIKKEESLPSEFILEIIDHLKEERYIQSIDVLKAVFSGRDKNHIKIAILQAFESFGVYTLSSYLIELLNNNDGEVRLSVIRALGACGDVNAVEPLYKMAEDSINPFLSNAIQKSIAKIQSRIGGAEKGWLTVDSLSEKDGGLSISDNADSGSLSIEENDKE